MSRIDRLESTEVVVVGGGPVGLVTAADLGWRGRDCILLERTDGAIDQPKMDQVGIRTMEFCRRWGIVDWVEASPYVRDYPQDNVYLTALNGYELGREPMPSMNDSIAPPESPQHRERCPQNMFDPILQRFADTHPGVELRYRNRFESFVQDDTGVTVIALNPAGERYQIRCKYLVGCDGGRSAVREQLGIGMQGRGLLTHTVNVVFRCADFNQRHDKRPGYRYMFVGPDGTWATIVAINGSDQWRMSIIGNAQIKPDYTQDEIVAIAHRLMGAPFPMEILSTLNWARMELVADTYQNARVFLAGDACHLTSPTGGLGMNTGIGDAVDLSWKLSANLEGWGGQALLDSYTVERRPVAQRITRFSTGNLSVMRDAKSDPRLFDDTSEGAAIRERVGHALEHGLKREWYSMNMHLGYRYMDSSVIVYEADENRAHIDAENEQGAVYTPSTRPGARAPHLWLADGRSTLDLFGSDFVLVCSGPSRELPTQLLRAARTLTLPLRVEYVSEAHTLYAKPYVLVRPDGHVAWRGDALPNDPLALLEKVTGLGPSASTIRSAFADSRASLFERPAALPSDPLV
ncbi:FAD-dependent monooxygenase [Pararobbsia silviterrae]|uniref:2-polyprenyl-6-methoxyphenol hydroxylase n=1 Tax=Pararobbsia silviterrae TaxID=1792498 RepID=A0A494Y1C5_9BURK|nr:FAD-dependent monooxygenase [Pararobbsia silviterrae]RKP56574.1 2-polyprenyl-6-methoxyphenol hydroxylase [Pararobbsia silviterrae]